MALRLIVCGGRLFNDPPHVDATLHKIHERMHIDALYEGGASGADASAANWRRYNGLPGKSYPADWDAPCRLTCKPGHRRQQYGVSTCPAAGIYRNHDMYDDVQPHLVIAFPGGNGTEDMIDYSLSNCTPVLKMLPTHTTLLPHELVVPIGADTLDFSWL